MFHGRRDPRARAWLAWVTLTTVVSVPANHAAAAGAVEPPQQELQVVVSTGRATETPLSENPGSVGNVGGEVLGIVQPTHINEAADRIAGTWISRGNGQEHLTAIRSPVLTGPGSCGAFLVLQDGIPTRPTGFCNVNQLFEINSEQAERIEVFRGPNSGVNGGNALHGIINVITPAVNAIASGSVRVEAGPNDYTRLLSSYSDGNALRINAHIDHDDGYKEASGFDQQKANFKLAEQRDQWRQESLLELTNLNQETASYIDGPDTYKVDALKKANPHPQAFRDAQAIHGYSRWTTALDAGSELQITPYANASRMQFLQHFIRGTPLEKNGHEAVGVNTKIKYPLAASPTLAAAHTLVSGFNVEAAQVFVEQSQALPATPPSPLFPAGEHYDFDVDLLSAAVFTEWDYAFSTNWQLISSARYDHQHYDYHSHAMPIDGSLYTPVPSRDDEAGEWGAQTGVLWQYNPRHNAYLTIARGFRLPQVAELYRLQGALPSELPGSEQMASIELGLRGQARPLWGDQLWYETALFTMRKDDVILQDSNRQYRGNGSTEHEGIELSISYWWTPALYLNLAATYAEHRYRDIERPLLSVVGEIDGNLIDTAPRHLGSLQLGKTFDWGLLEFELKHMGPYFLDPEQDWAYDGHRLMNLRGQYWLAVDTTLTLRVMNLADKAYAERADVRPATATLEEVPRYFVGEPRSLYLSIEKTF